MTKLYYIIILFILFGCNDSPPELRFRCPDNNLDVQIDQPLQSIEISEILDSIQFIFLETKEDDIIGDIGKVIYINQRYILHDRLQESIYVLSEEGKFISKISRKGPGPEEYPEISDFAVSGDTIIIFNRDKLFKYDLFGTFLSVKLIPFVAHRMELFENHYYFFRLGNTYFDDREYFYDLIICNMEGEIVNKYFPYTVDYSLTTLTLTTPFFKSEQNLFFISPTNKKVYRLNEGMTIDFCHFSGVDNGNYSISHYFETTYAVFIGFYGGMSGSAIISKIDESVISYNTFMPDEKFLFMGQTPKTVVNDQVISVLNLGEFGMMINNNETLRENLYNHYPQFKSLIDYIQTDRANPILVAEIYK